MVRQLTAIVLFLLLSWVSINHIIAEQFHENPTYMVGIFFLWMLGGYMTTEVLYKVED